MPRTLEARPLRASNTLSPTRGLPGTIPTEEALKLVSLPLRDGKKEFFDAAAITNGGCPEALYTETDLRRWLFVEKPTTSPGEKMASKASERKTWTLIIFVVGL